MNIDIVQELSLEERWSVEPSVQTRRQACGSGSMIILYWDSTAVFTTYRCHQWACQNCAGIKTREICKKISNVPWDWYVSSISASEYSAAKRRIQRLRAKFCAVGSGNDTLLLTDRKIFSESQTMQKEELIEFVKTALAKPQPYRTRRVRHSQGIFGADTLVGDGERRRRVVRKRIIVVEPIKEVSEKLKREGYPIYPKAERVYVEPMKTEFDRFLESPKANNYLTTLSVKDYS